MDTQGNIEVKLMGIFSGISGYAKMSNRNGNPNVNQRMEAYITDLFNILFETHNFSHLDPIKFNFKGVDIISQDESIGIQVTSVFSKVKVEEKILKAVGLDLPIKTLMMVYPLESKPKRTTSLKPVNFSVEEWSFNEIFNEIRKCGKKKLVEITIYLLNIFLR